MLCKRNLVVLRFSLAYRRARLHSIAQRIRFVPFDWSQPREDAMSKWSYVIGLLLIAIVACAVEEKKPPTEGDKAVVAAYVRAWNQHDSVALDTLIAADGVHEDLAQNFRGVGPKAVIAFMRGVQGAEPDYKWAVTNQVEDGDVVALEWTWTSTYSGPDPAGKQVTKKHLSGRGTSFAEVDNGKIKRFTDYYDMESFFR